MTVYRGSNAEYIAWRTSQQPLSFQDYCEEVLPVIDKAFPAAEPTPAWLADEAAAVQKALSERNIVAAPIPKTLYDLFCVYFRLKDRIKHDGGYLREGCKEKLRKHLYPLLNFNSISEKVSWLFLQQEGLRSTVPAIHPSIDKIEVSFRNREADPDYREAEYFLNNRIVKFFHKRQYSLQTLPWEQVAAIVDSIYTTLKKRYDSYPGIDFGMWDRFCYDFFRNYCDATSRKIVSLSIQHEYHLDPALYTVYRSSHFLLDNCIDEQGNPYSLSFSHSPLSGLIYDGETGSPSGCHSYGKDFYCVNINKADYHNPQMLASKLFYIPPARRMNRVAEHGEFGHVRTKIYLDAPDREIRGFKDWSNYSGNLLKERPSHPLHTSKASFTDCSHFIQKAGSFVRTQATVLIPSALSYSRS